MTNLKRRGLLGLAAVLPLALRAAPAAAARAHTATLSAVTGESVLGLAAPGSSHLGVTLARSGALHPGPIPPARRQSASAATPAPWGWDTLENVR
ncbi:hypothetical protein [Teichococcus aestuarii]|uniref:hypothetical protein n=1 Tax=Teichococcus aestuarii TaxID=568898 RepID=UPI003613C753